MPGYLAALALGAAGSLHCISMCGPLAGAVAPAFSRRVPAGGLYQLGRLLTYALLGLAAGAAGEALAAFSDAGRAVSIAAGVVMLAMAAGQAGGWRHLAGAWARQLGPLMGRVGRLRASHPHTSAFATGMLNGALPCGLVYAAALVAATTGSALHGAGLMLAFGAGTVPAMLAAWFATALLPAGARHHLRWATPLVLVVVGLMLIGRGLGPDVASAMSGHERAPAHHGH